MARRLFIVEDTFTIKGRGIVLRPALVPIGDEVFRVGDAIVLRRPDGSSSQCRIAGLELLCGDGHCSLVILLRERARHEIPVGTEVWSVDAPPSMSE